jgi:hypothetical protein
MDVAIKHDVPNEDHVSLREVGNARDQAHQTVMGFEFNVRHAHAMVRGWHHFIMS